MKYSWLVLLFFSTCLLASNSFAESTVPVPDKSLIGTIRNPDFVAGCGCFYQLPKEAKLNSTKYVFKSEIELQPAYMNIAGRDIKLNRVSSNQPRNPKKGDRFQSSYSAQNLKVRIDHLVTRVCDPKDESCEAADIEATIHVD